MRCRPAPTAPTVRNRPSGGSLGVTGVDHVGGGPVGDLENGDQKFGPGRRVVLVGFVGVRRRHPSRCRCRRRDRRHRRRPRCRCPCRTSGRRRPPGCPTPAWPCPPATRRSGSSGPGPGPPMPTARGERRCGRRGERRCRSRGEPGRCGARRDHRRDVVVLAPWAVCPRAIGGGHRVVERHRVIGGHRVVGDTASSVAAPGRRRGLRPAVARTGPRVGRGAPGRCAPPPPSRPRWCGCRR